MIENMFREAFCKDWVEKNITEPTNELVVLREIMPWDKMVKQLSQFYNGRKGRLGKSIRVTSAVLILSKLRLLSDINIIKQIKENRYYQYFCNIPDDELFNFLHPGSLFKIRKRYGKKGIEIIENNVFNKLRKAGVIDPKYALIDSSVLESNIVYPTDVQLAYKALCKMALFAKHHKLPLWWNHDEIKAMWR